MYLGLYRRTSLAACLSSFYKFSSLGKRSDRGIKSRRDNFAVSSRKKAGVRICFQEMLEMENNDRNQTPSLNESQVSYEEEFPSLSASTPKHKRRSRVDLSMQCDRILDKAIVDNDFSQLGTSTSNLQRGSGNIPASFVSKNQKLRRTHHERDKVAYADEPFDIYLDNESTQVISPRSCGNEKNIFEKLFPKPKLSENNEGNDDNVGQRNDPVPEHIGSEFGRILRPGMVLFKRYLSLSEQVEIVRKCRELGLGAGGFYRPGYNDGAKLKLHMMCLGLDWDPQTRQYGKIRIHDNTSPPKLPPELTELVAKVLQNSHDAIKRDSESTNVDKILPLMSPDVCIVNFYTTNGRLGLHQDRDESRVSIEKGLPVVSVSIGDSAEFLYGDRRDANKADRVLLESGDVLVFGGESRLIYHGVTSIISNTAPRALLENVNLRPGRLNLTFRQF